MNNCCASIAVVSSTTTLVSAPSISATIPVSATTVSKTTTTKGNQKAFRMNHNDTRITVLNKMDTRGQNIMRTKYDIYQSMT